MLLWAVQRLNVEDQLDGKSCLDHTLDWVVGREGGQVCISWPVELGRSKSVIRYKDTNTDAWAAEWTPKI